MSNDAFWGATCLALSVVMVCFLIWNYNSEKDDVEPVPPAATVSESSRAWRARTTKREQRIGMLKAKCFRDKGYYREFGNTAFCTNSLRYNKREILWEEVI